MHRSQRRYNVLGPHKSTHTTCIHTRACPRTHARGGLRSRSLARSSLVFCSVWYGVVCIRWRGVAPPTVLAFSLVAASLVLSVVGPRTYSDPRCERVRCATALEITGFPEFRRRQLTCLAHVTAEYAPQLRWSPRACSSGSFLSFFSLPKIPCGKLIYEYGDEEYIYTEHFCLT